MRKFTGELWRIAGSSAKQQAIEFAEQRNGVVITAPDLHVQDIGDCYVVLRPGAPIPQNTTVVRYSEVVARSLLSDCPPGFYLEYQIPEEGNRITNIGPFRTAEDARWKAAFDRNEGWGNHGRFTAVVRSV